MADTLGTAAALVRLSFLVQSVYAEVGGHYDLSPQQAQLLCAVRDAPRGVTELARMLRLDKSSLSGLVDRVERRDLLQRTASPHDRRAVLVSTTQLGAHVAGSFAEEVTRRLLEITEHLEPDEQACFNELASRIVLAEAVPAVFD